MFQFLQTKFMQSTFPFTLHASTGLCVELPNVNSVPVPWFFPSRMVLAAMGTQVALLLESPFTQMNYGKECFLCRFVGDLFAPHS